MVCRRRRGSEGGGAQEERRVAEGPQAMHRAAERVHRRHTVQRTAEGVRSGGRRGGGGRPQVAVVEETRALVNRTH